MPKKIVAHILRFKASFLLGAVVLVLFYAFSFLVSRDIFTNFDFDMTVRIQHNIPLRLDPLLSWFSILGSFEVTLVILIVFVILRFRKNAASLLLIPAFAIMHIVEIIGKAFLDHPGTPFMFHRYSLDLIFPSSYVQPGGSYPSGHAMRSTYLAVLILFLITKSKLNRNLKIGIWIVVLVILAVMFVSRVSLGEHWTTDVIGGSLLALSFSLFSLFLL